MIMLRFEEGITQEEHMALLKQIAHQYWKETNPLSENTESKQCLDNEGDILDIVFEIIGDDIEGHI